MSEIPKPHASYRGKASGTVIIGKERAFTEQEAAEVIRRAEAYNPWISVSERLPKEKGYINVADTKTKTPQTWYWENTNIQADLLKAYFTHWKPIILPEQALKEQPDDSNRRAKDRSDEIPNKS